MIAFIRAILEAAGETAHSFTSPHLVAFHERISLTGPGGARPISEARLVELLLRVEEANADEQITFFEITTAAALLAYAEKPCRLRAFGNRPGRSPGRHKCDLENLHSRSSCPCHSITRIIWATVSIK